MNKMKWSAITLGAALALASYQPVYAFGDFLKGMVTDMVKETATETAKETAKTVAKQQGVQGADMIIDGAANYSNNGGAVYNAEVARIAAQKAAMARHASQPASAAMLRQYPPQTSDLNRDGVVTMGEIQQIQTGYSQPSAYQQPAAGYQPADLNRDGMVTQQEIAAYKAALSQVGGHATPVAAQQTQPASAGGHLGKALGSALGGLFGGN